MSEFTKGEWQTVFFKGMVQQELYVKVSGGACICKILDAPLAQKKANANLIASAPKLKQQRDDLLVACDKAKDEIGGFLGCCGEDEKKDSYQGFVNVCNLLEAELAKAK